MIRRNFLVDAPRVEPSELDMHLEDREELTIHEFEDAWRNFLFENPDILPTGEKGSQVEDLEDQLEELELAKKNAASELNRQLKFFSNSKDRLESNFKRAMAVEAATQQRSYRTWNTAAENAETAHQIFKQNLPWENFFSNLEKAVEADTTSGPSIPYPSGMSKGSSASPASGNTAGAMKPSARAFFLVSRSSEDDLTPSKDLYLRAYRIDNALLSSQVKQLQREIQYQERATKSLEILGKFLIEHGIWGLMTNKPGASTVAASQTATMHSSIPGTGISRPSFPITRNTGS